MYIICSTSTYLFLLKGTHRQVPGFLVNRFSSNNKVKKVLAGTILSNPSNSLASID